MSYKKREKDFPLPTKLQIHINKMKTQWGVVCVCLYAALTTDYAVNIITGLL